MSDTFFTSSRPIQLVDSFRQSSSTLCRQPPTPMRVGMRGAGRRRLGDSMVDTDQKREPQPFLARPNVRRILGFAAIAAVSLIFIFQNSSPVTVRLLVPEVTMPLWGALLIAWALGLAACTFTLRRRR